MIGQLCESCNKRSACDDFGISSTLISRLMIGKSVQKEGSPFPINLYKKELEQEKLDPQKTLRFLETISPHCIYSK